MFRLRNKHDLRNLAAVDHILPRMLNVVVAPYRAFDGCGAAGRIIDTTTKKTNDFVDGKPQTSSHASARLMAHHRERGRSTKRVGWDHRASPACVASGVDVSFCAFHARHIRSLIILLFIVFVFLALIAFVSGSSGLGAREARAGSKAAPV
ncbi:MAG: hypothetical protein ACR65U_13260 [Methylocystis sp.]